MRKRKGVALFLAVAMVFCYIPGMAFADDAIASDSKFADMPSDWSTEALKNAVDNGLISGYNGPDGTKLIKPTGNLTRAEMATIVNRAFGATETAALTGVGDVPADAWYATDMAKAVKMETFKLDNQMRPNDSITRQEAFTVLARAFKVSCKDDGKALDVFTDKGDIASWAKDAVCGLAEAGYVAGLDGKVNPTVSITRAEFAKIMDNMVKVYITKAETVKNVASGNVMVNVPGVTLDGVTINGNLIIGDGVGIGNITLNNVKVTGETIVRGGGEITDSTAPVYSSAAISNESKTVTLTFNEALVNNTADDAALKAAVTFATDGSNYSALVGNDKVSLTGSTLVVTFENALTGSNNKIKVAANTLKDAAGNVLSTETVTAAVAVAAADPEVTGFTFTPTTGLQEGNANAAVGQIAGVLSAPVGGTADFTYSLVAGAGDTDNANFEIDGTNLKIKNSVLTEKEYSIRIQIKDSKGKIFDKSVSITVAAAN